MQKLRYSLTTEDKLEERTTTMLDARQSRRREIVRTIVRFAEKRKLTVDWVAAIRYILNGTGSMPIISNKSEKTSG